jgi:acetate kinase
VRILALNSGSSSIKCAVLELDAPARRLEVRVEGIGGAATLVVGGERTALGGLSYPQATDVILSEAASRMTAPVDAAAHRIVHGGSYSDPVVVDGAVVAAIERASELAPLHNPPALAVLRAAQRAFAAIPHVAVFDTAFHRTLPGRAREYALPRELSRAHALYRAGFHGISHAHVLRATAECLRTPPERLRLVSCHLGNGASVAAIEWGRSVETSMGMTPLEGLVMGTRCGDLDPGVALRLLQTGGFDVAKLDKLLNAESGLLGLCGTVDFAAIERRAAEGDEDCRRAIAIFAHRVRKYIGAYAAVMGGLDAIAFTGGIGERSALARHRICQNLGLLGAVLDEDRNRDAALSAERTTIDIAAPESRVRILAVRADEEGELARTAAAALAGRRAASGAFSIPVAVSARHAHLSVSTVERLFGAGYRLRKRADLAQPGQYSAEETVTLIGPRGRVERVRLMGPPRGEDQIEISRSDEFVLGVDAPVRLSGDLAGTPGLTLEGPRGRVTLERGVICARRHIHMSPDDAARLGVRDGQIVEVRIDSDGRDLTFADVIVRVAKSFSLELHLDADEANAAGVEGAARAILVSRASSQEPPDGGATL